MKKYLENRDLIILIEIIVIFILLAIISIILLTKEDNKEEGEIISISTVEKVTTLNSDNEYYVDIKGSVKKPGVYKVKEGTIVNDQTTPNMIQGLKGIFARKPLISKGI